MIFYLAFTITFIVCISIGKYIQSDRQTYVAINMFRLSSYVFGISAYVTYIIYLPIYDIIPTIYDTYHFNGISSDNSHVIVIRIVLYLSSIALCIIIRRYYLDNIQPLHVLVIVYTVLAIDGLITTNNFIILFILIELQSFGVYAITTCYRNSKPSGVIYLIVGAFISAIILIGIALIYSNTGTFDIYESIHVSVSNNNVYGLLIVCIAILGKVAAAPIHFWAVSVYNNTPVPVSVWLIVVPKIGIISVFINSIIMYIDNVLIMSTILTIICILSLLIGAIIGVSQWHIKKILTYSTINHVGFILIPMCIITSTIDTQSHATFYLIQYTWTNTGIIIALLLVATAYVNSKYVVTYSDIQGIYHRNIGLTISVIVLLLSIAGIPPIIGFLAKITVIGDTFTIYNYIIGIVAIISSVISTGYYLTLIKVIVSNTDSYSQYNVPKVKATPIQSYVLSIIITITSYVIQHYHLIEDVITIITANIYLLLHYYHMIITPLLFIFIVPIVVSLLLIITLLFAPSKSDAEKVSVYDCGIISINDARSPFPIAFYLVAILFLVFDVELVLLYPLSISIYYVDIIGYWIAILFFIVLTIGFVFEIVSGSLNFTTKLIPIPIAIYIVLIVCIIYYYYLLLSTTIYYYLLLPLHKVITH